jgi:tRNA-2-methylthio-N6-dimethylallyladenosine synthase
VVPHVRGREVSRPLDEVLREVEALGRAGCREVVLLGQNVNSYRDPGGNDFPALLAALDRQGAIARIRFTTSHPKDASRELVAAMAALPRVCPHIHLALQSGSNRILALMNRGYTREHFLEIAALFRRDVPGISITTDFIVGFPSETDADFQESLAAIRAAGFDQAFSFAYSPRPGTAAASLPDDVTPALKAERLAVLQGLILEQAEASLRRLVGRRLPVLVEGPSARDAATWAGRTGCNRVTNFTARTAITPGQVVPVTILETRVNTLRGEATLADAGARES